MTKKIFNKDSSSISVTTAGRYPTHSVVGQPNDFYVYVAGKGADSWSVRIKNSERIYRDLSKMHNMHKLNEFVKAVEDLWKEYKKLDKSRQPLHTSTYSNNTRKEHHDP